MTTEDKLLGKQVEYPQHYCPAILVAVPRRQNREIYGIDHPDHLFCGYDSWHAYEASFILDNGIPVAGMLKITYPASSPSIVESKSLKLYLYSFRNHGDFHEDCMNIIMKDLIKLMDPKYIEVWGKFTPRGGISIDPYTNYGKQGTMWEQVATDRLVHHDLYPEKVDNR